MSQTFKLGPQAMAVYGESYWLTVNDPNGVQNACRQFLERAEKLSDDITPQQAAKVLLKGGPYSLFDNAFTALADAMDHTGEPERAFSAALKALSEKTDEL